MADPQVLIVGAGPTGLVLALWLAKAGIPLRIFDKTDAPGTTSRAIVMHARNLEFYRQLGIERIAIDGGVEVTAINLWRRAKHVARVAFGNLGIKISAYPYALIFTQDLQEQMLVDQLKLVGVTVERETELVDFAFEGNGVSAELRKKSGEREIVKAAYLAGCDGGHSTVREKLGIDFPGGDYADTFYVADIQGSGPVFNGEMNMALDEADFLAIFPMKGQGKARLVGAVRKDLHDKKDLSWDDVSPVILRDLKMNVEDVKWFSTYRVHHRVAAHFQKQRAFLLGDAAHVHSPVGGQGMNTGIGDAVNLAWKLAAVLQGTSEASLLDTYESERIAFARRLVATTDRVFSFMSSRGRIAKQIRFRVVPRLLPFLSRFGGLRRFLFRTISQIAIKYPQSPLSHGPAGTTKGGERLPWVQCANTAGKNTDNFASLSTRAWQVHRYGDAAPALKAMCDNRGLRCQIFPWSVDAKQAGLRKNAAYVVRPDGYIAIVDHDADPARISAYLDKWMKPRTSL
jgi:2-polyprenyl-6-methoxyphenol hydroxylase-like FAD-dependent oxidoreductase